MTQFIASCPSSCVVCSEEVTLCQGLTYILAAPATTKALIVTDGKITSIESFNLFLLLNITLLRLSSNGITDIKENAFNGLTDLRTLLLDHNQISSSSITDNTFSELQKLQMLVLSNNALSCIYGTWFKNMKSLIRLHLQRLDLSNNFISFIEKSVFQGLPELEEMDLSRNRLTVIPDAFSPLTQLNLLSLDQNPWDCSCKLGDLAFFLRNYVNSSARMLKNANSMDCRTSKDPSVGNVLDLSEANCKPAPHNSNGILKNKRRNYGRDIALVAVFSFLGAVGLTCLVLAFFNWKLQQGKANEHTSENCCCRTLDESQCGHEPRNYLTKGYCNCHLTQENETKVTSVVGSSREMPLLQENSHQATEEADTKSIGLETQLGGIHRENAHRQSGSFLCLNCRLVQSCPEEPSGPKVVANEAGVLTTHFLREVTKPRNLTQKRDLQTTGLEELPYYNKGGFFSWKILQVYYYFSLRSAMVRH
uniref:LRRCT domain-containing protein n=1 Tax=Sphenodon punctatus TaxID=8508 RepID=A0A8D0GSE3_SPHPU